MFSCTISISNSMIYREIWKNHALVCIAMTRNNPSDICSFEAFQKLIIWICHSDKFSNSETINYLGDTDTSKLIHRNIIKHVVNQG